MTEILGFHPWQIFTLLFGTSCTIIKYFNSFLMTIIICVAFGGLAEVVAKFLFVWKKPSSKLSSPEKKPSSYIRILEDDTDEELEEKYANLEVNFDESETEEEEYISHPNDTTVKEHIEQHSETGSENVVGENPYIEPHSEGEEIINHFSNNIATDYYDVIEDYDDDVFRFTSNYTGDIPVSRGKSFIQDDLSIPEETKEIGMIA